MSKTDSIAPAEGYGADPYFVATPEARPFWDAAAEGRLLLKHCRGCSRAHWYPRSICPLCGSDDTEWIEASGQGTVYACTPIERANPPYVVAYVKLAEGPLVLTNLVDFPAADLRIDAPVSVRFVASAEGRSVPVFTPAA